MACEFIAIDGPSASGKSTVARRVAAALGFTYVDSGALYRGLTWYALGKGVDMSDPAAVVRCVESAKVTFELRESAVVMLLDGRDPGAEIRTRQINESVSRVAALPAVREKVVAWLREMAKFGSLAMEGRDIGTVVFPSTPHKFYLDADAAERARRRAAEMQGQADLQSTAESLQRRDTLDSRRQTAPLKIASGARVIDSTRLSIDQVVEEIVSIVAKTRVQEGGAKAS